MEPKPEQEFEPQKQRIGTRNKPRQAHLLPTLARAVWPRHLFGSYFPWQKRE